jgi:hypothetical protein
MLDKTKYTMLLIATLSLISMFSFSSRAGEVEKGELKKVLTTSTMNVEVINANGNVEYTDVITADDQSLDFNLESMPIGTYSVRVSQGNEVINTTQIRNVSSDANVITVEVLNEAGDKVYESVNTSEMFDLSSMPHGNYVINIYQGSDLINTNNLKN